MHRLKELRLKKGLGQKDMSKIFGVALSTYYYWESGTVTPDTKTISKLAEYFDVSIDYLIGKSNTTTILNGFENILPIEIQTLPLLGDIACGEPMMANEDRDSYINIGAKINADFCLRAKGDSMINARISDGDIVFIKQQEEVMNGEIAAVIINDSVTLKRVFYYPENKKLILQAENPKYEPLAYIGEELEAIRILGKAIAFQSDVR